MIDVEIKGEGHILKMQPGDVLMLKFDRVLTNEHMDRIKNTLKAGIPEGVKALILEHGCEFEVVRPADPT